jgi:hypothetical protein
MKKNISILLFLFVLYSCDSSSQHSQAKNQTNFNDIIGFKSEGFNVLNLENRALPVVGSLQYSEVGVDEYLSMLNFVDNRLIIYSFDTGTVKSIIKFDHEGPHGVGLLNPNAGHFLISLDSVLVYNTMTSTLYLCDSTGRVKRKYDIIDYKSDDESPVPFSNSLSPISYHNGNVYFPCKFNSIRQDFTGYKSVLRLNLQSGEREYLYDLPREYSEKFWGISHKYMVSFAINTNTEKVILNYPIIHELIESDMEDKKKVFYYAGSQEFEDIGYWSNKIPNKTEIPSRKEYQKITDASFSSSDYSSIMYDKYRNLYYRVANIRPDIEVVRSGNRFPSLSIIILDANLQKVGEDFFDSKTYHHSMFFVSREGLNIARKDKMQIDEDHLYFEVFKPKTEISKDLNPK